MVLAAPELVIAEPVELFDEVEIAAELQHRMLAHRMVRGEESAEIQTRHDGLLWPDIFVKEIVTPLSTATMRPCLVTDSRVNLRFASWSSRPRHLALNFDAVMVCSDATGHPHLTDLYTI